jgi:hypothetical protein
MQPFMKNVSVEYAEKAAPGGEIDTKIKALEERPIGGGTQLYRHVITDGEQSAVLILTRETPLPTITSRASIGSFLVNNRDFISGTASFDDTDWIAVAVSTYWEPSGYEGEPSSGISVLDFQYDNGYYKLIKKDLIQWFDMHYTIDGKHSIIDTVTPL